MSRLTAREIKILGLSALVNVFLLVGLTFVIITGMTIISGDSDPDNSIARSVSVSRDLVQEESQVVQVVEQANDAVVAVVVTGNVADLIPFGRRFGGFFDLPDTEQEIGGGSGFFVTSDGMIVTNRHVVDTDGATYTVVTNSGERLSAEVIATDPVLDIAILQVETTDRPYLQFADSSAIKLGQSAVAIGNALGEFQNTVSTGVVSGLSRSVVAGDGFGMRSFLDNVVQTDAAINPGNSGGPLLDLTGRVIGVNVAVAQGSENIGFAIPSNEVLSIVESVMETGEIARPFLGIRYNLVTSNSPDLDFEYGFLISGSSGESGVVPGSAADEGGLEEGDVIVAINGQVVDQDTSLSAIIRRQTIGEALRLTIVRESERIEITATLEQAPQDI